MAFERSCERKVFVLLKSTKINVFKKFRQKHNLRASLGRANRHFYHFFDVGFCFGAERALKSRYFHCLNLLGGLLLTYTMESTSTIQNSFGRSPHCAVP